MSNIIYLQRSIAISFDYLSFLRGMFLFYRRLTTQDDETSGNLNAGRICINFTDLCIRILIFRLILSEYHDIIQASVQSSY
jgi:hypothetical protein